MKMHLQRTLHLVPRLWTTLTLEIIGASLLYTCLIIILGIAKSTSFFITLGIVFLLVILNWQFIPRHLLLLKDEEEASPSRLPTLLRQLKSSQQDQIHLQNAIAAIKAKEVNHTRVNQEKSENVS